MVQVFSASDAETPAYASKVMGDCEMSRMTSSLNVSTNEGTSDSSQIDRMGTTTVRKPVKRSARCRSVQ